MVASVRLHIFGINNAGRSWGWMIGLDCLQSWMIKHLAEFRGHQRRGAQANTEYCDCEHFHGCQLHFQPTILESRLQRQAFRQPKPLAPQRRPLAPYHYNGFVTPSSNLPVRPKFRWNFVEATEFSKFFSQVVHFRIFSGGYTNFWALTHCGRAGKKGAFANNHYRADTN